MEIRPDQWQVFAQQAEAEATARLVRHVQIMYPEAAYQRTDAEQVHWVQTGLAEAVALDIRAEEFVARYLDYRIEFGEQFRVDPDYDDVNTILDSLQESAHNRIVAVDELMFGVSIWEREADDTTSALGN
ncbi:MAG: hypothetical protein ACRCZF_26830 [Gemmataceae bacterium]